MVVVAAAGNDIGQGSSDGTDGTGPFYPAAYKGVLAVGAVGPGGVLAGFSDRYTPVGVTAPGVNVTSAYPGTFPAAYEPAQNGTSFAAAFVSGVVALVRSAHPGLNAAQVVARIEATAHGGTAADAFDVVVPSIPGYGFSGKPATPGWDPAHIARAWVVLMKRLGYTRFVAQGGDWGAQITDVMGAKAPPGLLGIHSNMPGTVPPAIAKARSLARLGADSSVQPKN